MAEANKKQPRKSKLVIRECIDLVEEPIIKKLQEPKPKRRCSDIDKRGDHLPIRITPKPSSDLAKREDHLSIRITPKQTSDLANREDHLPNTLAPKPNSDLANREDHLPITLAPKPSSDLANSEDHLPITLAPKPSSDLANREDHLPITLAPKPSSVLAKLSNLKNKIDNDDSFDTPSSSFQCSVEIEVEECEDKKEEIEDIPFIDHDDAMYLPLNSTLPTKEVIVSDDVIRCKIESLMKETTSIADKLLEGEIRNYWGRNLVPQEESKLDQMLQKVIHEWKVWNFQSKLREGVTAYKCNICKLGWWHFAPFREHLSIHKNNLKLKLDTTHHECYVIASTADDENYSKLCLVKIEGHCWQCLKDYEQHMDQKKNSFYYICDGCHDMLPNCRALFLHEGICSKSFKLLTVNEELLGFFKCEVCHVPCITKWRLEQHILLFHNARSDIPISTPPVRTCNLCDLKYITYNHHMCPKKTWNIRCKYCYRKFPTKYLAETHEKNSKDDYYCRMCHRHLKKECMAVEHMARHSNTYVMMWKCIECVDHVLFPEPRLELITEHKQKWHGRYWKKYDKRRAYFEYMIVPRECVLNQPNQDIAIAACNTRQKPELEEKTSSKTEEDNSDLLQPRIQVRKYMNRKLVEPSPNINSIKKAQTEFNNAEIDEDFDDAIVREEIEVQKYFQKKLIEASPKLNSIEKSQTDFNNAEIDEEFDEAKLKEEIEDPEFEDSEFKIGVQEDGSQDSQGTKDSQYTEDTLDHDSERDTENDALINETADAVNFLNKSIKQEIEHTEESRQCTMVLKDTEFGTIISVKSEFAIKEEKQDEEFSEEKEIDQKEEENEACNELSKVFRASKDFKGIKVTGFSLLKDTESVSIKEEPMDEDDYVDDIIVLNNSSEPESSNLDTSAEIDPNSLEPEVNINETPDHKYKKKRYSCTQCDFVGIHKDFKNHVLDSCPLGMKKRSKNSKELWDNYPCTRCLETFLTFRTYVEHFKRHGLEPQTCPSCLMIIPKESDIQVHLTGHIKISFLKIQLLKESAYVTSRQSGLYQCRHCAAKVSFKNFFMHWERHFTFQKKEQDDKIIAEDVPEELQGEIGDQALEPEEIKLLLDHLVKPAESRDLNAKRCVLCADRTFERKNDCKRHLIEHLLADAISLRPRHNGLRCQMCFQLFPKSDLATYKRHMRDHGSLPVFKCEICDKAFSDSSNFAKHKKVHNLQVMQCDICQKKFHSKTQLLKHMEVHKNVKPIYCDHCDKLFIDPTLYNRHKKRLRDYAVTKYPCRVCGKRFPTLRECWDHQWEVHKERKHKADCPICNKSFRKFQDVRNHLRTVHKQQIHIRTNEKSVYLTSSYSHERSRRKKGDIEEFLSSTSSVTIEPEETLVVYE